MQRRMKHIFVDASIFAMVDALHHRVSLVCLRHGMMTKTTATMLAHLDPVCSALPRVIRTGRHRAVRRIPLCATLARNGATVHSIPQVCDRNVFTRQVTRALYSFIDTPPK